MATSLSVLVSGTGLAAVRLVTGLARSKGIASLLGLEGVGMMAQATQFQLVAASASSLSVTAALIQGAKGDFAARSEQLFRAALFIILCGLAILLLLATCLGPTRSSALLFGGSTAGSVGFLLVLFSVPFVLLASNFLEASFFIHDRFDRYVAASSVHSMAQAAIFVAFAWIWGPLGVLAAFPVSAFVLFLVFAFELHRLQLLRASWFLPKWDRQLATFLAGHGSALFLTGVCGGLVVLFVRSALVARLGLDENGLLQVPIALSAYGSAVVTNFVWARIHPHCSAGFGDREEGDISFAVICAFIVALGIWSLAPMAIPLVYSREFLAAAPLVGLQCAGDVFYYSFFVLGVAVLARGGVRLYVAGWAAYYLTYLSSALPWLSTAEAVVKIHILASVLAFLVLAGSTWLTHRLPGRFLLKLTAFAGTLGLAATFVCTFGPSGMLARLMSSGLACAAGIVAWRAFYGRETMLQETASLKKHFRRALIAVRADRALGILLRQGLLPRRMERIAPQYRDFSSPTIRRLARDGVIADLDLSDLPDWKAYFRRRDKKRERMYSLVTPGAKVLEIGCARGWVALNLARIVGPSGAVVAADAHRPSVEAAAARFAMNGFTWASVRCLAFSDRPGTVNLAPEAHQNSASVSISSAGTAVRAVRLDDWLAEANIPDPDILKISVNGWETQVVKGAMEYLRRKKPLLFTEVGDFNLRRGGSSPAELLGLLRGLGYRIETTWGDPRVPEGDDLNACLFDVVCFPPSSRD